MVFVEGRGDMVGGKEVRGRKGGARLEGGYGEYQREV